MLTSLKSQFLRRKKKRSALVDLEQVPLIQGHFLSQKLVPQACVLAKSGACVTQSVLYHTEGSKYFRLILFDLFEKIEIGTEK